MAHALFCMMVSNADQNRFLMLFSDFIDRFNQDSKERIRYIGNHHANGISILYCQSLCVLHWVDNLRLPSRVVPSNGFFHSQMGERLITRETVATDTQANSATSRIVGITGALIHFFILIIIVNLNKIESGYFQNATFVTKTDWMSGLFPDFVIMITVYFLICYLMRKFL